MEDRQKSPRTRSDRGFVPQSRKSMSRLSCTYCKSTGCKCYKSSPGRGSFSSVCGSMESYYSRKMDFTAGTGRSQLAICKDSDRKRNKRDKVCRYSENYLYIRRGRKLVRKKCHRESSKTARRPRVLQHLFHCAEKRRRISTNFKSAKSQFVPCCSTLQDGNIAANNLCSGERRLGSVNRPQGCILSCSSPSEVQEIPSILHTGEAFPISRNAVWIGDSAKDIHQTNVRCGKLPEVTSDTDLHVFGRLADQESGQTSTKTTDFASLGGDSRARSVSELDKVLSWNQHRPFSTLVQFFPSRMELFIQQWTDIASCKKRCRICRLRIRSRLKTFLQLLGLMASFIDLTPFSRLHMRPIQFYVLSWWKPHKDSMFQTIPVKETLFQHLQWWTRYSNLFAGIPLATPHTITIWTDASMFGWGAHMEDQQVSGVWNPQQSAQHINWLELKAVDLALHHFQHQIVGKSVLLRCDNSTVVSYINKQGGTKSFQMCCLAWEVFQWSLQKGIVLKAAHIPGKRNILADHLSRGGSRAKTTEWSLCQEIVKIIFDIFTTPNIDLFATKENRKLQIYCSPFPDPLAWATDALSVNWTGMYAYAFPPPILIPQVLRKVLREECVLLLVAPFAPRQSWYPQLLNLLVEFPRKLPALEGMLTQKRGQFVHPSPESLNLVVWKITRNQNLQNDFLRKLGNTSSNPAGRLQGRCMMPDSPYIEAGVIKGKSVRILQL